MRIGLCTGGGDCPGLNAAIRAVVKHAIGNYQMEVIGIHDSFDGLTQRPYDIKPLNLDSVSDILFRGGTILGTRNSSDPRRSVKVGTPKEYDVAPLFVEAYRDLKLDAVVVIGGDGTQEIASRFVGMGLNIVGIPKTIDNDLGSTDISIGFQTAVDIATESLSRLKSTAESHDRIMVLEVMGRDAGHIALHSGIAGGADLILIPEIPFSYEPMLATIERRKKMGRWFSIVVVAEGAFELGRSAHYQQSSTSKHVAKNLGGIGAQVAEELFKRAQIETRITVLGHVQRGGTPCPYDRILASALGVHAVDLVHKKHFGYVVGMKRGGLVETPYADIAGISRPVPLNHYLISTAEGLGICLGR